MQPSSNQAQFVVAICTPIRDRPSTHFIRALSRLLRPPYGGMAGTTHQIDVRDQPVHIARTTLTAGALRDVPGLTHILWVDDDMQFPQHALQQLLAHDKDIVGGLCHNRRAPAYQPIAARRQPEGVSRGQYAFVYDLPQSGLVEVDATGGAFLLVKAEVFKTISAWEAEHGGPEDCWWQPIGTTSEDFSFCERAKECGYRIFIDCGLDIGHLGEVVIDRNTAGKLRTMEWSKWFPLPSTPAVVEGKPVATIVIPTYNQKPKYLNAAVLSALNQTVPVEVIVVDDGTTDYFSRTPDEAAQGIGGSGDRSKPERLRARDFSITLPPQVKLIRHHNNKGIAAALNSGIAAMTTEWFCWLSSDDMLDPKKVERQLNAMLAAGAKASFHDYSTISNAAGHFSTYVQGPTWRTREEQQKMLLEACCINGSTVMLHKSVLKRRQYPGVTAEDPALFFDISLRYAQDWEMWLRIGIEHLWLRIPEQLGLRREGENLTAALAAMPESDARRKQRDEEDRIVRERYAPKPLLAYSYAYDALQKVREAHEYLSNAQISADTYNALKRLLNETESAILTVQAVSK